LRDKEAEQVKVQQSFVTMDVTVYRTFVIGPPSVVTQFDRRPGEPDSFQ
jgi:hypothetical protein